MQLGSSKALLCTSSVFDVASGDINKEHVHGNRCVSSVQAHMIQEHVKRIGWSVGTVGKATERGRESHAQCFSDTGRQLPSGGEHCEWPQRLVAPLTGTLLCRHQRLRSRSKDKGEKEQPHQRHMKLHDVE